MQARDFVQIKNSLRYIYIWMVLNFKLEPMYWKLNITVKPVYRETQKVVFVDRFL